MVKTWKPTTAGILSIIAGAMQLLLGIVFAVGLGLAKGLAGALEIPGFPVGILAIFSIPIIILGIVAVIGGVYALKRSKWGLALAGSICALIGPWILGIPAIIFVIMGKNEFV